MVFVDSVAVKRKILATCSAVEDDLRKIFVSNGISPVVVLVFAHTQRWTVPDFHLDVCEFLDNFGPLGVLMMPRGHGKSTLLEIYNAYRNLS